MSDLLTNTNHDGYFIVAMHYDEYNDIKKHIDRHHKKKMRALNAYYKKKGDKEDVYNESNYGPPKYPQIIVVVQSKQPIINALHNIN